MHKNCKSVTSKIAVRVKYFTDLENKDHSQEKLYLSAGTCLEDILKMVLPISKNFIVVLNGRIQKNFDIVLKDQDVVALFSPIAGG
jgi:molybdopterin converting factor small subunit